MHTTVGLDAKEISNPQVRFRIQDVFSRNVQVLHTRLNTPQN